MKFLIVAGHDGTTGAASGKNIEEVITKQLSDKICSVLKEQGYEAIEPPFNLYDEVSKPTFATYLKGFDYVLEVHFNSFNGQATGTEIFVAKGITGISVEKAIMQRMSKFFKLRDPDGVKNENFKTTKYLQSKGALLEVCFLDSKSDMEIYLANTDKIAREIAYGLMDGFGLPIKDIAKQDPVNGPYVNDQGEKLWFRAIEGSYETRAKAMEAIKKLGGKAWLQAVYVKEK